MTAAPKPARAPADQAQRELLEGHLTESFFVSAGAGSGKTTAMVRRLAKHIEAGVDPSRIVAITFSVASAADIRDRLREYLEAASSTNKAIANALEYFDDLTLTTIHGFALKLLREHGVTIGMPPHLEIMSTVEQLERREQTREAARSRLYSSTDCDDLVRLLYAAGGSDSTVVTVLDSLADRWSRVEQPPLPSARALVDWKGLLAACDELLTMVPAALDPDDTLAIKLENVTAFAAVLRVSDDQLQRVAALSDKFWGLTKGELPQFARTGKKDAWAEVGGDLPAVRSCLTALFALVADARGAVAASIDQQLLHHLVPIVKKAADDRRRAGTITHDDTLALLEEVLRARPDVRDEIVGAIDVLFVDEFQDTDPLQAEILGHLAGESIKLFTVGDPMQSIYRFRGADVHAFESARELLHLTEAHLSVNFRSTPAVLRAVNSVFHAAMSGGPPQVAFAALEAHVEDHAGLLGRFGIKAGNATESREAEAADIVAAVLNLRAWHVGAYSGITILFPARGALGPILRALESAGIPTRVESRELLMETNEVTSVVAALTAIVQPNDQIAVVAALRSLLFACSDAELAEYRGAAGGFKLRSSTPEGIAETHSALLALRALDELRQQHHSVGVGAVVKRLLANRRVDERALADRRPRDVWRRYDFILDRARAFDDGGGRSLVDFLTMLTRQEGEPLLVNDRVVPEADDDAVRLMTMHGAKGLEFEAVIVCGVSRKGANSVERLLADHDRRVLCRSTSLTTNEFTEAARVSSEAFKAEKARLLYVACTRAKRHLLVSVHAPVKGGSGLEKLFALPADKYLDGLDPLPLISFDRTITASDVIEPSLVPLETGTENFPVDPEAWAAQRTLALARLARRRSVAATAIAKIDELPAPADDSARRRGHGATAVGRAVHSVLQVMSFAQPESIANLAASFARAEGVADRVADVEKFARRCLSSPVVQEAIALGTAKREVYVAAPVGDRVIEGFIDLLFTDANGDLVVVDYKTDSITGEAVLNDRLKKYRLQGATYALALEKVTRRRVSRCVFVFADAPDRLREETIANLEEAKEAVVRLVKGEQLID